MFVTWYYIGRHRCLHEAVSDMDDKRMNVIRIWMLYNHNWLAATISVCVAYAVGSGMS